MSEFQSKTTNPVALITGASRGLGKTIALTLLKNSYNLVVNYFSSGENALLSFKGINKGVLTVKADVRDLRQVEEMAVIIEETFGRLDFIINNAGLAKDNLLFKQTEQEFDEIVDTNLKGCFHVLKIMAPIMIKSGGGHIVNISSYSGVKGKTGQAAYSASKAALIGLTYTAAREFAGYNIKVNALLPGYMKTDMGERALKAMETARTDSLLKSLSAPEDVAGFILHLLSTKNITGQVFSLDSRII